MNDLETKYYEFLIQENEKYNLTNITNINEVEIKHFNDSYMLGECFKLDGVSLCDVGSGAGFPSIALKIKYPTLKVTIIESMNKRCNFLKELVNILGLNDVNIICARAEDVTDLKESFDIVTARAVASMPILMEVCSQLVKVGGYFAPMKGSNYTDEIKMTKEAETKLGFCLKDTFEYNLKDDDGNDYGMHAIIKYEKVKHTDNLYPRSYAQIKKKSL